MALIVTPPMPTWAGRSQVVQIGCTGCHKRLVVTADGRRLRRLVPKLERVHTCGDI